MIQASLRNKISTIFHCFSTFRDKTSCCPIFHSKLDSILASASVSVKLSKIDSRVHNAYKKAIIIFGIGTDSK